jgi:plasmid stability protein
MTPTREITTAALDAPSGRRAVMAAAALAGAAALFTPDTALAKRRRGVKRVSPALTFADIPGAGDIKVLNYALALEDLEADLYAQALARLTGGGTNRLGTKINGLNLGADQPDVKFTIEFGRVEAEHRDFLRSAITAAGGPVIPQFRYDFGMQGLNRKQVGDLLLTAESLGVQAYLGAIPFFDSDDSPYIPVAAAILGTEARHTAVFASVLNTLFRASNTVAPLPNQNDGRDTPLAPDKVLATVSPFVVV